MKKKFLSSIIILSILAAFIPVVASAARSGECGLYGGNVTWTLDDSGTLTISGNGDMEDYYSNDTPFLNFAADIKAVVIEDGVTSIGRAIFTNCSGLTSVTIPSSITEIDDGTFDGCGSLTSVAIPDNVTSIGKNTFYGCKSLTSVTIPEL